MRQRARLRSGVCGALRKRMCLTAVVKVPLVASRRGSGVITGGAIGVRQRRGGARRARPGGGGCVWPRAAARGVDADGVGRRRVGCVGLVLGIALRSCVQLGCSQLQGNMCEGR